MSRRDYDGNNALAMIDPTAGVRELIAGANFDGEACTFWLRSLVIRNTGVDGVLEVYDQNAAVAVAANKKLDIDVPANSTTVVELPGPGVSFKVNITAGLNGALGTVAAYAIHAGGYLVGGQA